MDAKQLDTSSYTHIHFAFATLTQDYQVVIGDDITTYEFQNFLSLTGSKRILSFGGWDFSTDIGTYMIFRNGVTAANRITMAANIANFIKDNNLDGVDIDWEYPGVSFHSLSNNIKSSLPNVENLYRLLTSTSSLPQV
jgi:GH18 family chitinase